MIELTYRDIMSTYLFIMTKSAKRNVLIHNALDGCRPTSKYYISILMMSDLDWTVGRSCFIDLLLTHVWLSISLSQAFLSYF